MIGTCFMYVCFYCLELCLVEGVLCIVWMGLVKFI